MRKLHFEGGFRGALNDFSSLDLGTIVAVAAPSLTGIRIRVGPYAQKKSLSGSRCEAPSSAPAGFSRWPSRASSPTFQSPTSIPSGSSQGASRSWCWIRTSIALGGSKALIFG